MWKSTFRPAAIRKMASATPAASEGPLTRAVRMKITEALQPVKLDIFNDSHKHRHHRAMQGATNMAESHFRLHIVSQAFQGKPQPARHRMVYSLLKEELEMENGIHGLQLKTRTVEEEEKMEKMGGEK